MNILAIIVVTIISMGIGMFWYSEKAFGLSWMKLVKMKKSDAKMDAGTTIASVLATAITTVILSFLVSALNATTLFEGIALGALVWLGFSVPIHLNRTLWENTKRKLMYINAGHNLVMLAVAGAILAIW